MLRAISVNPRSASATANSFSHGSRDPRPVPSLLAFLRGADDYYERHDRQDRERDVPVLDGEPNQEKDAQRRPAATAPLLDHDTDRLVLRHRVLGRLSARRPDNPKRGQVGRVVRKPIQPTTSDPWIS